MLIALSNNRIEMNAEFSLIADMIADLPRAVRAQRMVRAIREQFNCHAVGLLKVEGDVLSPLAFEGLAKEAIGRRFVIAHHPRLVSILSTRTPVRFLPGNPLPDPYDGLLDDSLGEPLPVHDCLGISLHLEGMLWGALTLDAFEGKSFHHRDIERLSAFALLVEAAVRVSRLEEENRSLRLFRGGDLSDLTAVSIPDEILGQSPVILSMLRELDVAAESDLPILLMGETGVGKDLFAKRVHRRSLRNKGPLVQVNCAALPESLAESELFGHIKGTFSGATADRAGRIEAAEGGTLFLDEVGELPLSTQAKLLRTLQNGEIQRLGEDKPRKVNVRFVSATNRQLQDSVRAGRFRADLYHRLSVYPVHVPPLRERGTDVLILAGRFLEMNRSRLGLRGLRLSERSELALCRYDWPGNVRELEHVISRAALRTISQGGSRDDILTLEPEHLLLENVQSEVVDTSDQSLRLALENVSPHPPESLSLRQATDFFQRQHIKRELSRRHGNWAKTARSLGVDTSNLHKLAKRLGLKEDNDQ